MTMSRPSARQLRQQETRAALLVAAERCFADFGYEGASVPAIAKEAGFTTGAIYSNFRGKEDLFLALMDRAMGAQAAQRAEAIADVEIPGEQLQMVGRLWSEFVTRHPRHMVLLVEFWSYSRREPGLQEEFAQRLAVTRDGLAALIAGAPPPAEPDAAPPAQLAMAAHAMAHGLAMHHLADPDGVPIELFEQAVSWLFRGAGHDLDGH